MCGIAGFFNYRHGSVDQQELTAVRDHMASRGPDGAAMWLSNDRSVGLAHRRLSLIDLSPAGAQPMLSDDGRLAIVFNGEIYNYRRLREQLEAKGRRFRSHSDTEVLLQLYQEKGPQMVHELRGMYAFAVWDPRRGMFLARDPFGIKPLYYADNNAHFKFASQVKALLRAREVDTSACAAGHAGFFLWGTVPAPYTLYQGIRVLPAGHTLQVDLQGRHHLQQFCDVSRVMAEADQAPRNLSVAERRDEIADALRDSVKHHLVADVPVGMFLSSGIDSSVLTALAVQVESSQLRTICLGFDEYRGTADDETLMAAAIGTHYGTSHQTRWVSDREFHREFTRLFEVMDQPSIDGVNTYFVSKAAAETGLKAAISGIGGDELLGGYPGFRQIPALVKMLGGRRYPRAGAGFRRMCGGMVRRLGSPKYAGVLEFGGSYAGAYLLRRSLYMPWEIGGVIGEDMAREGLAELNPMLRLEQTVEGISSARLRISALEMCVYMRQQLLRDADWAGMAHSLEIRVPFVDVELLRRLGPLLASDAPPSKEDAAKAAEVHQAGKLIRRPKTGFNIPTRDWIMQIPGVGEDRGLRGWAKLIAGRFQLCPAVEPVLQMASSGD